MMNEHYNKFSYDMILPGLSSNERYIPYWKAFRLTYVEIAIWPLLYLRDKWCESAERGNTDDHWSAKKVFPF